MNVLSLFDGMSCGQIALNRCGIAYNNYYASEIDKYAIKVTQANYPNTIQIGDVRNVKAANLPKIDLLIGGSPCQGFSFAGKQLNFEDERSKLFFEYVRLWKELEPTYFLLENVKMKKEYEDIISGILGCKPLRINSALVSAQNRQRLYWTNIPVNSMPEDKGILLKDILIDNLPAYGAARRGRYNEHRKVVQRYELNGTEKSNALTTVSKDSLVMVKSNTLTPDCYLAKGERNRDENGIAVLTSMCDRRIRKLLPIEAERLQTVPEGYTRYVSNVHRSKMLGNGWTVDVICHIFKHMKFADIILK